MKPAKKNTRVVTIVALPALMALGAGSVNAGQPFQTSENRVTTKIQQESRDNGDQSGASINLSAIEHNENIARLAAVGIHMNSNWVAEVTNYDDAQLLTSDLQERIFNVADIRSAFFNDIGGIAGDIASVKAKEFAGEWADSSPLSFVGVATGGSVAVGAYGYLNGSEALEELGINPKLKMGFFDNRLTLKAQPFWEAKFENVGLEGAIGSEWDFGDSGQLQGEVSLSQQGLQDLSVSYQLALPKKEFSLHAQGGYNVQSGRTQAAVALWYQPAERMDVALLGSVDSDGESRVGVSVTWRL